MRVSELTKIRILCALIGLGVTAALVAYQVAFDHPSLSRLDAIVLLFGFVVCPPSLFSVPIFVALFEAAETGSPLFYFLWFLIAVSNALLYSAVGPLAFGKFQGTKTSNTSRA